MQKINLDKQSILFLILVVVIVGELFLLLPLGSKRIINLNAKIALVSQQLKAIERDWPNKEQYLKNQEQLKMEIENMEDKFIFPHQASKPLSFISASSKNFGVEIQSFLPGELQEYTSSEIGELFYLPIKIKAKARFHNLALFLDYLQNSKYFFDIKQLNITSDYPYNSVEMILCGLVKKK